MDWRRADARHLVSDCGRYLVIRARVPVISGRLRYQAVVLYGPGLGSESLLDERDVEDSIEAREASVDRMKAACEEHARGR
jgi:hypothetical protein